MKQVRIGNYVIDVDLFESVFPIVALVFTSLYYYDTRPLPANSMLYADPLVYITGGLSVAALLVFGVRVNRDGADGNKQETASMVGFAVGSDQSVKRTLQILVLISVYVLAIRVQFVFATLGFLAAGLYILSERQTWILVAYSVSVTAVVYGVFIYWLNIPI